MAESSGQLSKEQIEQLEQFQYGAIAFEDYVEARGAWAYIFWTLVFILAIAIVYYSNILYIFEVLFALFLFRFFSWFGMEYYRCN